VFGDIIPPELTSLDTTIMDLNTKYPLFSILVSQVYVYLNCMLVKEEEEGESL